MGWWAGVWGLGEVEGVHMETTAQTAATRRDKRQQQLHHGCGDDSSRAIAQKAGKGGRHQRQGDVGWVVRGTGRAQGRYRTTELEIRSRDWERVAAAKTPGVRILLRCIQQQGACQVNEHAKFLLHADSLQQG